jgi:hypothetical protein
MANTDTISAVTTAIDLGMVSTPVLGFVDEAHFRHRGDETTTHPVGGEPWRITIADSPSGFDKLSLTWLARLPRFARDDAITSSSTVPLKPRATGAVDFTLLTRTGEQLAAREVLSAGAY